MLIGVLFFDKVSFRIAKFFSLNQLVENLYSGLAVGFSAVFTAVFLGVFLNESNSPILSPIRTSFLATNPVQIV